MKVLSASTLKIIAIMSMLIDHIGAIFFPTQYVYRMIGRISYPIFAFLVSESMIHTTNHRKYLQRLVVFGIISQIPFDLAFSKQLIDLSTWNIMFTLLLGAMCIGRLQSKGYGVDSGLYIGTLMILAQAINVDGGAYGVLTIVMFYCMKDKPKKIFMMLIFIYGIALGWIYKYAICAFLPIYYYNGKKGRDIKWFVYYFYPLHLLVLAVIYYYFNLG